MAVSQSSLRPGDQGASIDESVHGVDDLLLPGFGEAGDDCGEWRVAGFCDGPTHDGGEVSHVDLGVHQCGRRGCPDCWMRWARERTVSSVVRLGAGAEVESPGLDRRTVHATVSPPEGAVTSVSGFFRYRSRAVEKAREAGIRGGLVVPHAFRATDAAKETYREQDPDKKLWAWIRECSVPWRELVEWGPHYHVVGLAREVEPVGDGWVVRRLSTLDEWDRNDRDAYNSRAAAVRYVLSHTTYPEEENRQVVTWFGSLHGTNFDPEEELTATVLGRIEELAEEVVGAEGPDDGDDGDEEEEEEPCPVDGCPGRLHAIHDLEEYLDRADVSTLNEMALRTSLRWARGDIDPPPGLDGPEEYADAREALVEMVRREYAGTARFERVRQSEGSWTVVGERVREMMVRSG